MIHEIIHNAVQGLSIDGLQPELIFDTQGLENLTADNSRKSFIYIPIVNERTTMELLHITSFQVTVLFAHINPFGRESNESYTYYNKIVKKLRNLRNQFFLNLDHMKDNQGRNIAKILDEPINSVIVHQDTKFDVPATIIQSSINIEVINYAGIC